jgi:hypothetical protein
LRLLLLLTLVQEEAVVMSQSSSADGWAANKRLHLQANTVRMQIMQKHWCSGIDGADGMSATRMLCIDSSSCARGQLGRIQGPLLLLLL